MTERFQNFDARSSSLLDCINMSAISSLSRDIPRPLAEVCIYGGFAAYRLNASIPCSNIGQCPNRLYISQFKCSEMLKTSIFLIQWHLLVISLTGF